MREKNESSKKILMDQTEKVPQSKMAVWLVTMTEIKPEKNKLQDATISKRFFCAKRLEPKIE